MTRIILVRHGQTDWNRVERFRGRVDIPLNKTGLTQARNTSKFIRLKWKPSIIYSSPLKRAMQTAQYIAEESELVVNPVDGLIDIDYGKWQGLSPEEVRLNWPEMLSNWYKHPAIVQIPDGETLKETQCRGMNLVNDLCKVHIDDNIVLVSHTVVNRLIILDILGLGIDHFWNIAQEPCAINVIEKRNDAYILCSLNITFHL